MAQFIGVSDKAELMSDLTKFITRNCRVNEKMRYYLLVVFISLAVFKVMMQIHEPHFDSLCEVNYGVIRRWPHWIAHQNRLLGPYTVYLISKIGLSYADSLRIFIFIMTLVQNILIFSLLLKMKLSLGKSLNYVVVFSFLFLGVQHFWIHTWDNIDLILFTLFSYGIFQQLPFRYFLALFVVALFNRETVLFVSLYLIIDAFGCRVGATRKWRIQNVFLASKRNLCLGTLLTLIGLVYIKLVRMYLFDYKRPTDQQVFGAQAALGNHFPLMRNISDLFFHNFSSIDVINTVFIVGSTIYVSFYFRHYSVPQFKALLMYLVMIANILIFGLVNETRMLMMLLPFLIFFHVEIERLRCEAQARLQGGST